MKNLYKKTEQFVVDAFESANKPTDVFHARRTAYWVKKLKPDADSALLIAGLTHDLERAFYSDWKAGSNDPKSLKKHQDLSAFEIAKFLQKENVDKNTIERIKMLVAHHEDGGNEDQNIVCDADCLAYFEEKALRLAKTYKKQGKTKEGVRKTLAYVFDRITSLKAKKIARPFYNKAIKALK